jgi:hypothetical protein
MFASLDVELKPLISWRVGSAKLVEHSSTGKRYRIEVVQKPKDWGIKGHLPDHSSEIEKKLTLDSPWIVNLQEVNSDGAEISVVEEYFEHETLSERLHINKESGPVLQEAVCSWLSSSALLHIVRFVTLIGGSCVRIFGRLLDVWGKD